MALTIARVADAQLLTSAGIAEAFFYFTPGSNDYVTGGYVVNGLSQLGIEWIIGVDVVGNNSAAAGYAPYTTLNFTAPSVNATQLNFQVYTVSGFTPAGTNSAPTITTTTNAGTTTPVYTNGGALTQVAGATGITGVQAPVFTGTAIAASSIFAEVANGGNLSGLSWVVRIVGFGA